jgi:hypothetical protein
MLLAHQILVQLASDIGFSIATNLGNPVRSNDLAESMLSDTCVSPLQRREWYFKRLNPAPSVRSYMNVGEA